ncbi:MAG: MaoC family dehydratase N-terminal domain-containing protein [Gammaproteobacteria bacterium]|nr:MaoC family dehydratase N-terminal domain-containing protein [Gammaproteobacteria bacterium]
MDDIEQLKEQYVGHEFDAKTFSIDAEKLAEFARTCGEVAPRYTDPADPDFQACPTFSSSLMAGRNMPEGFPMFGGIALDGGKEVVPIKPIRPGVDLVGRSHVHDVYAKTGRSGRMIFVVSRMEFFDPDGQQMATADTRLVIKEKQPA